MASSEHEVSGTTGTAHWPASELSARGGRLRLGKWLIAVAAAAVVAGLAAVLLGRAGAFTTSPAAGSAGASRSWQTYHDPHGLFTLQLPPGWTAETELGTATYGDSHSGSVNVSEEMINFSDPAQGTGSAHFWIVADSLKSAEAHQMFCQEPSTLQRYSPRTLSTMEQTGAVWLFTTETASFQVDVGIPGFLMPARFGHPWPTGTPLPATWVDTDKTEVNAMLVSFQPTDPKPLIC